MCGTLKPGDIVQHFKRQWVKDKSSSEYLYEILAFARHTETDEILVVYKALYGEMGIWARPYEMFMGKVDGEKYPDSEQEYRFEKRK
ncbi:MAG: DUF1653 domain-containing protein [Clostridia bacterium]|nr:DUF1653 domain-containing protein [Lachnospiraceae bacterium]NCC00866.1 DUF1653 domain-containing protein [Clostridia bacterium]NCD02096.1 DUF1653 domain-containing protein [Clostridia bacterium]